MRRATQPLEGGVENRGVGLGGIDLLRDDHLREAIANRRARQSWALHIAEPVGDERQAVLCLQAGNDLACALNQMAGAGEVAEIDRAERRRRQRLAQGLEEQFEPSQAEPLARDLPILELPPDARVDLPIGAQAGWLECRTDLREGLLERRRLRPVVVK